MSNLSAYIRSVNICICLLSLGAINAVAEEKLATFAGGCFWCMESDFEKLHGVNSVISGYTGGSLANPTYKQVSSGNTGHTEAVQILFDSSKVSFEKLLVHFWANIDPEDANGQFCDRGLQYRSEIFYHDEAQKRASLASLDRVVNSGKLDMSAATEITMATNFYAAEPYHQDYYKKNSARYRYYRWSCGRDKRLQQLWGTETSE